MTKVLAGHDLSRPRLYCPVCGEVRGSTHYVLHRNGSATVLRHNRNDGAQPDAPCPGGPADPVEDRAT